MQAITSSKNPSLSAYDLPLKSSVNALARNPSGCTIFPGSLYIGEGAFSSDTLILLCSLGDVTRNNKNNIVKNILPQMGRFCYQENALNLANFLSYY